MRGNKKTTTVESLPEMPEERRKLLRSIVKIQSVSNNEHMMHYFLTHWLDDNKFDWTYDVVGNIIVEKGRATHYPCIVAHLDTVHDIVPDFKIMKTTTGDGHLVWYAKNGNAKTGIGGDDKCGIFAVLHALETLKTVKAVFFTGEERGCVGSSAIALDILDDAGYIIQLDRWGRSDFICKDHTTSFVSEDFQNKISALKEKYGYRDESGLVTDSVKLFRRGIGVSCINLSCGYYQHHSDSEKIDLHQLWNATMFAMDMIKKLGCKEYPHKETQAPAYNANWKHGKYNGYSGYKSTPSDYEVDPKDDLDNVPNWASNYYEYDTNGLMKRTEPQAQLGFKSPMPENTKLEVVKAETIPETLQGSDVSDKTINSFIDIADKIQHDVYDVYEDKACNMFMHVEPFIDEDDMVFGIIDTEVLDQIFIDLDIPAFNNHKYDILSKQKKDAIKHEYFSRTKGCFLLELTEVGY